LHPLTGKTSGEPAAGQAADPPISAAWPARTELENSSPVVDERIIILPNANAEYPGNWNLPQDILG
jgi:hypothetical protein